MHSLVLFDTGFCFIYLAFLLFLPIQMPPVLLLLLAFVTGFTLDIFYDTGGIHAAATVLLAYLRPYILLLLTPRDGYDQNDSVNLHIMGWRWFFGVQLYFNFSASPYLLFLRVSWHQTNWVYLTQNLSKHPVYRYGNDYYSVAFFFPAVVPVGSF